MRKILLLFFLSFFCECVLAIGDNWFDIIENKAGRVTFYWYPNNVRILDSKDIIDGFEHDMAVAFVDYLNEEYDIELEIEWIETNSFEEVMSVVRNETGGVFGASSISITAARRAYLNFTPPYMADVAVLVSNATIPIAHSDAEFNRIFRNLTAVTIQNTTLKDALEALDKEENLDFVFKYVQNSGNVIEEIEQMENGFGYIDLPNFLVALSNNSAIRRQFFKPIMLEGLAMIYPLSSDWNVPVKSYFESEQFQQDKTEIIVRYLGEDVSNIIERIAKSAEIGPFEEIVISNREKELQYEKLLAAAISDKEKSRANNILILIIIAAVLVLLLLYISNAIKSKANRVLIEQQNIIAQRNQQLQVLNEEKNDLIKILAHDLRSPLATISGSSMVLRESKKLTAEEQKVNDFILDSSGKIESMITKILDVDAIESGKRNMKTEAVDLKKITDSILENILASAKRKEISITTNLSHSGLVSADRFYITQIIENLLSNAVKFSNRKSNVDVKTSDLNDHVRISIKDQGPGFTPEDQKYLFKKYQRLSAVPTAGEPSTGLGLSIVKLYTEMMNGEISYTTKTGSGTEFFVDLPKYIA